jgi:hypothetical protein
MYDQFWDIILPSLRRMEKIFTTPYSWDSISQSFVLIETNKYLIYYRILTSLIITHMIVMFWNFVQALRHESSLLLKVIVLAVTAITFSITKMRWMHQRKKRVIIQFLNWSIAFQRLNIMHGN